MINRVYELRKLNKMTQDDLASRLGVTRQTIISIEKGKYVASLQLALKMSKVFGIPVDEIFQLEDGE
jgi:putative transcriptional regulator